MEEEGEVLGDEFAELLESLRWASNSATYVFQSTSEEEVGLQLGSSSSCSSHSSQFIISFCMVSISKHSFSFISSAVFCSS